MISILINKYNDCRKVICVNCCLVEHKVHNTVDISTISDKFRQQLRNDLDTVCRQLLKGQKEEITNEQLKFLEYIVKSHAGISDQIRKLRELVDSHANSLQQELSNFNIKFIKEIEMNKETINRQCVMFECFTKYCQEVIEKATASEVARLADDLHARARELQDMTLTNALPSPQVKFAPLDILDVLNEDKLERKLIERLFQKEGPAIAKLRRP